MNIFYTILVIVGIIVAIGTGYPVYVGLNKKKQQLTRNFWGKGSIGILSILWSALNVLSVFYILHGLTLTESISGRWVVIYIFSSLILFVNLLCFIALSSQQYTNRLSNKVNELVDHINDLKKKDRLKTKRISLISDKIDILIDEPKDNDK